MLCIGGKWLAMSIGCGVLFMSADRIKRNA